MDVATGSAGKAGAPSAPEYQANLLIFAGSILGGLNFKLAASILLPTKIFLVDSDRSASLFQLSTCFQLQKVLLGLETACFDGIYDAHRCSSSSNEGSTRR